MANIIAGIRLLLSLDVFVAMAVGVLGGIIVGALPGFSAPMGVALLIPLTYTMEPIAAISMLTAMYTCATYGGSITAILCHTPGTSASAATAIDGYPLTKQGRGMEAVSVATIASVAGGVTSAVIMLLVAPALGQFSLKFSVLEYFLLALFGLSVIGTLAGENMIKGLFSGVLGLFLGTIGLDKINGYPRMTFGLLALEDGINYVPALIGLFSISQVMTIAWDIYHGKTGATVEGGNMSGRIFPSKEEFSSLCPTIIRSSLLGTLIGIVPACGTGISSWVCYSTGKALSKKPELFGKGSLEAVASSESGNNAAAGGALIPLITLGIPGSSVAAIIMGGMMIQGLQPGGAMFSTYASTTYGIMVSFLLANILMGVIGLLFAKQVAKVSLVPMGCLGAVIIALSILGTYAINNNIFDVLIMWIFGGIGFLLIKLGFATAPIVLGMVLSTVFENNLRRSVILASAKGGLVNYFLSRPICIVLAILILVSFFSPVAMKYLNKKAKSGVTVDDSQDSE